jgi:hypothetical protein
MPMVTSRTAVRAKARGSQQRSRGVIQVPPGDLPVQRGRIEKHLDARAAIQSPHRAAIPLLRSSSRAKMALISSPYSARNEEG